MAIQPDQDDDIIEQPADEVSTEALDRGDDFTPTEDAPKPDLDALQAIVAEPTELPKVDEKLEERQEDRNESRIPKARFDEVNEERKQYKARVEEMERRLAAVEAASKPAATEPTDTRSDLEMAEEYYIRAIEEGNKPLAQQIRNAINQRLTYDAAVLAEQRVTATLEKKSAESSMISVANQALAQHDFLNEKSPNANPEAIDDVIGWRDQYMARGMSGAKALERAIAKVVPLYAPKVEAAPAPEPKVDTRARAALEANAKAAAAQPSLLMGVGERASTARHNVKAMSDEQIAALPDAEKKRLRGD